MVELGYAGLRLECVHDDLWIMYTRQWGTAFPGDGWDIRLHSMEFEASGVVSIALSTLQSSAWDNIFKKLSFTSRSKEDPIRKAIDQLTLN